MLVVRTVGEIEARDVHSRVDEVAQRLRRVARRPERANDFGATGHGRQDAIGCRAMQTFGRVSLAELANDPSIGTPSYIHDLDGIAAEARALEAAFGSHRHLVCYAVKANSAGPVVRTLAKLGLGADVVSGPELELALRCGVAPSRIVYSGVAKMDDELDLALQHGILAIQAESVEELVRIA